LGYKLSGSRTDPEQLS